MGQMSSQRIGVCVSPTVLYCSIYSFKGQDEGDACGACKCVYPMGPCKEGLRCVYSTDSIDIDEPGTCKIISK